MANRLEGRVAKLERVANVVQSGCIIFYENTQSKTTTNAAGDKRETFISGDFNLNGKSMDMDEINAHLMDEKYRTVVFLPLRRSVWTLNFSLSKK